jgi:osmotically-inducible protein OsmY
MKPKTLAVAVCLICSITGISACASDSTSASGSAANGQQSGASQKVSDVWIDTRLETAYLFNSHLNNFNIQTDVDHGAVLLTGTVQSDIDKDLAGEIARSLKGVRSVDNQLVIKPSAASVSRSADDEDFSQKVDDATTTANVKTRLIANQHLSGLKIDVDTKDSVVTLTGDVASDQERQLAGLIAKNTPEVQSVKNQLEVADSSS